MQDFYRQFPRVITAALFILFVSNTPLPAQHMRNGVVRMKVSEALAAQLESRVFTQNAAGETVTGVQSLDQRNRQFKVRRFTRVFPYAGKYEAKHRRYGLHLWYTATLDSNIPVPEIIQSYLSDRQILKVEPVYEKAIVGANTETFGPRRSTDRQPVRSTQNAATSGSAGAPLPGTSNDPLLATQWHYNNSGQTGGTPGADIRLFNAWKTETGNPNVIIAVTDGGIQADHPDLAANIWTNPAEIAGNGLDDDDNGYVDDIHGYGFANNSSAIVPDDHGTHVAGTIAAVNNNGIGVAGIAGGSGNGDGVRLMSCAVFNSESSDGFPQAYVYSADNGAVISQNSWGYTRPGVYEQAVIDAIDYFIAEAGSDSNGFQTGPMRGGLVIFSAGNFDDESPYYPAAYEPVLAVASTNHKDVRARYSNYGAWVDVAAPGGETYEHTEEGVVSTLTGSQYGAFMGTSMACPHVAGVAALILSHYQRDGLSPEAVRRRLVQSVDDIDTLNAKYAGKLGAGRLNAGIALREDDTTPPKAVNDLRVIGNDIGALTVAWTSPEDPGDDVVEYDLRYATTPITDANFYSATPADNAPAPDVPGATQSLTFTHLPGGVLFYFAIRASDFTGNISALSNVIHETSAEAPSIAVDPATIAADLKTAEHTTRTFTIINNGKATLTFDLTATSDEHHFATPTPTAGEVAPGGTKKITVLLSAAGLLSGTYHQALVIAHNDPLKDPITIPVVLKVANNGFPIARVAPLQIDFKSGQVGTITTRQTTLYNDGSDALSVIAVTSDSPDFSSPARTPISVPPLQHVNIPLHFSPKATGVTTGTIAIQTNDPSNPVLTVGLRGDGLQESPVALSPAAFSDERLQQGTKAIRTLVMQNNSAQDRSFQLEVANTRLVNGATTPGARTRPDDTAAPMSDSLRRKQQRMRADFSARMATRPAHERALAAAVQLAPIQKKSTQAGARTMQTEADGIQEYHTNFDNFPTGSLSTEGWSGALTWTVSGDNPNSGNQHLRGLSKVTGTPENIALSPYLSGYEVNGYPHYTSATMRVNADHARGATWEIVPQDPWSYVATRIRFEPDGSMKALVVDNYYNILWEDIPAEVPAGYFDVAIEYNNWGSDTAGVPTYDLFINNEKVFSGTGLAAGIGQVAFVGTMETAGPVFDVDDFSLIGAEYIPRFLKPQVTRGTLPAGQSVNIGLEFDATVMKYGTYQADLVVRLDEVDSLIVPAALTVTGPGNIIQDIAGFYVETKKGETATRQITFTNTGGTPVHFSVAPEKQVDGLTVQPASGTIPVRGEQVVTVELAAQPGLYENAIMLSTDITGSALLRTPFNAVVFQTETLFSAPDAVTFDVRSGATDTKTITLHNDGKNPVSFKTSALGAFPWISVTPARATFGPPSLDLNLHFDASALAPGTYASRVEFTTNDLQVPMHEMHVTLNVLPNTPDAGQISWEKWTGIPGTNLSDIPLNAPPANTALLSEFASPSNSGDHYGDRIRGFIHAPADGYYTFFIASNDHSMLWLSTDESEGNKRVIASVSGYTHPLQWNKYASQTSARIYLEANRSYYIEALHKEGVGADHLAVGWQLPDGTLERPVQGVRLSPFEASPSCSASGTLSREFWTNIPGSEIADIPVGSTPDGVETLTTFEGPVNAGTHYGARLRGIICAPATGDYYFWIASNDHSELWLSTDDDPANKVKIAFVSGATAVREWDKFQSQKSVAIPLVKGKTYYIEALHKQGVGTDHIAVGWQRPDDTLERPMRGDYLSPFVDVSSSREALAQSASFPYSGEQPRLEVFPNPVRGENLNITIGNFATTEAAFADVEIRQFTGMPVFTTRVECSEGCDMQIPVQEIWIPGVYILQVRIGQQVLTGKLIVP